MALDKEMIYEVSSPMVLDDGEKTIGAMPISTHPCLCELRIE